MLKYLSNRFRNLKKNKISRQPYADLIHVFFLKVNISPCINYFVKLKKVFEFVFVCIKYSPEVSYVE